MLGRVCFIAIILGLIALVCLPITGDVHEVVRIAVIIAGVIWLVLQVVDNRAANPGG